MHLRVSGGVLLRDRVDLGRQVSTLCRRSARRHSAVVQLDLSRVTALAQPTIYALDQAFGQLRAAGWRVRVSPPDAAAPRAEFIQAAIRHDLGWARGSEAPAPEALLCSR